MGIAEILAQIDREIVRLQQARGVLTGDAASKGSGAGSHPAIKPKKRRLTPEGRKRIAEAVKRRWAEQKKKAAANK